MFTDPINRDGAQPVKMALKCEISVAFVPGAEQVKKKICRVFRETAVDFLEPPIYRQSRQLPAARFSAPTATAVST